MAVSTMDKGLQGRLFSGVFSAFLCLGKVVVPAKPFMPSWGLIWRFECIFRIKSDLRHNKNNDFTNSAGLSFAF